eukprot:SAG22_NODE_5506_length_1002_cov_1.365449_1_plen_152_part_00
MFSKCEGVANCFNGPTEEVPAEVSTVDLWVVNQVFVKHTTSMQTMITQPCVICSDGTTPVQPAVYVVNYRSTSGSPRPNTTDPGHKVRKKVPARMVTLVPENEDHLRHDVRVLAPVDNAARDKQHVDLAALPDRRDGRDSEDDVTEQAGQA